MTTKNETPKLAPPGAGLPPLEWAVAKFIMFPTLFRTRSSAEAIKEFEKESNEIIRLVNQTPTNLQTERRLIPRLRGLEDSSRYWSIAMTLEHLVIVGHGMRQIISDLAGGGTQLKPRGTADVKPSVDADPAVALSKFEEMSRRFIDETSALDLSHSNAKHPHPWFGPLNARQWLIFAAPHESIHRKQIESIIARL